MEQPKVAFLFQDQVHGIYENLHSDTQVFDNSIEWIEFWCYQYPIRSLDVQAHESALNANWVIRLPHVIIGFTSENSLLVELNGHFFGSSSSNFQLPSNKWYHLALNLRLKGENDELHVYLNGELSCLCRKGGRILLSPLSCAPSIDNAACPVITRPSLIIGCLTPFQAKYLLAECRFWSCKLSLTLLKKWKDQEINDSHPSLASLEAYYHFTSGSYSDTELDCTGAGRNLTWKNFNSRKERWIRVPAPIECEHFSHAIRLFGYETHSKPLPEQLQFVSGVEMLQTKERPSRLDTWVVLVLYLGPPAPISLIDYDRLQKGCISWLESLNAETFTLLVPDSQQPSRPNMQTFDLRQRKQMQQLCQMLEQSWISPCLSKDCLVCPRELEEIFSIKSPAIPSIVVLTNLFLALDSFKYPSFLLLVDMPPPESSLGSLIYPIEPGYEEWAFAELASRIMNSCYKNISLSWQIYGPGIVKFHLFDLVSSCQSFTLSLPPFCYSDSCSFEGIVPVFKRRHHHLEMKIKYQFSGTGLVYSQHLYFGAPSVVYLHLNPPSTAAADQLLYQSLRVSELTRNRLEYQETQSCFQAKNMQEHCLRQEHHLHEYYQQQLHYQQQAQRLDDLQDLALVQTHVLQSSVSPSTCTYFAELEKLNEPYRKMVRLVKMELEQVNGSSKHAVEKKISEGATFADLRKQSEILGDLRTQVQADLAAAAECGNELEIEAQKESYVMHLALIWKTYRELNREYEKYLEQYYNDLQNTLTRTTLPCIQQELLDEQEQIYDLLNQIHQLEWLDGEFTKFLTRVDARKQAIFDLFRAYLQSKQSMLAPSACSSFEYPLVVFLVSEKDIGMRNFFHLLKRELRYGRNDQMQPYCRSIFTEKALIHDPQEQPRRLSFDQTLEWGKDVCFIILTSRGFYGDEKAMAQTQQVVNTCTTTVYHYPIEALVTTRKQFVDENISVYCDQKYHSFQQYAARQEEYIKRIQLSCTTIDTNVYLDLNDYRCEHVLSCSFCPICTKPTQMVNNWITNFGQVLHEILEGKQRHEFCSSSSQLPRSPISLKEQSKSHTEFLEKQDKLLAANLNEAIDQLRDALECHIQDLYHKILTKEAHYQEILAEIKSAYEIKQQAQEIELARTHEIIQAYSPESDEPHLPLELQIQAFTALGNDIFANVVRAFHKTQQYNQARTQSSYYKSIQPIQAEIYELQLQAFHSILTQLQSAKEQLSKQAFTHASQLFQSCKLEYHPTESVHSPYNCTIFNFLVQDTQYADKLVISSLETLMQVHLEVRHTRASFLESQVHLDHFLQAFRPTYDDIKTLVSSKDDKRPENLSLRYEELVRSREFAKKQLQQQRIRYAIAQWQFQYHQTYAECHRQHWFRTIEAAYEHIRESLRRYQTTMKEWNGPKKRAQDAYQESLDQLKAIKHQQVLLDMQYQLRTSSQMKLQQQAVHLQQALDFSRQQSEIAHKHKASVQKQQCYQSIDELSDLLKCTMHEAQIAQEQVENTEQELAVLKAQCKRLEDHVKAKQQDHFYCCFNEWKCNFRFQQACCNALELVEFITAKEKHRQEHLVPVFHPPEAVAALDAPEQQVMEEEDDEVEDEGDDDEEELTIEEQLNEMTSAAPDQISVIVNPQHVKLAAFELKAMQLHTVIILSQCRLKMLKEQLRTQSDLAKVYNLQVQDLEGLVTGYGQAYAEVAAKVSRLLQTPAKHQNPISKALYAYNLQVCSTEYATLAEFQAQFRWQRNFYHQYQRRYHHLLEHEQQMLQVYESRMTELQHQHHQDQQDHEDEALDKGHEEDQVDAQQNKTRCSKQFLELITQSDACAQWANTTKELLEHVERQVLDQQSELSTWHLQLTKANQKLQQISRSFQEYKTKEEERVCFHLDTSYDNIMQSTNACNSFRDFMHQQCRTLLQDCPSTLISIDPDTFTRKEGGTIEFIIQINPPSSAAASSSKTPSCSPLEYAQVLASCDVGQVFGYNVMDEEGPYVESIACYESLVEARKVVEDTQVSYGICLSRLTQLRMELLWCKGASEQANTSYAQAHALTLELYIEIISTGIPVDQDEEAEKQKEKDTREQERLELEDELLVSFDYDSFFTPQRLEELRVHLEAELQQFQSDALRSAEGITTLAEELFGPADTLNDRNFVYPTTPYENETLHEKKDESEDREISQEKKDRQQKPLMREFWGTVYMIFFVAKFTRYVKKCHVLVEYMTAIQENRVDVDQRYYNESIGTVITSFIPQTSTLDLEVLSSKFHTLLSELQIHQRNKSKAAVALIHRMELLIASVLHFISQRPAQAHQYLRICQAGLAINRCVHPLFRQVIKSRASVFYASFVSQYANHRGYPPTPLPVEIRRSKQGDLEFGVSALTQSRKSNVKYNYVLEFRPVSLETREELEQSWEQCMIDEVVFHQAKASMMIPVKPGGFLQKTSTQSRFYICRLLVVGKTGISSLPSEVACFELSSNTKHLRIVQRRRNSLDEVKAPPVEPSKLDKLAIY